MSRQTKTTATNEEATPALVPKLRFPEFRKLKGWSQKSIGEVCRSFSGGTPSTAQKDYYGGSIRFIRSAEIDRSETELSLTDVGLTNSAAKLVAKGDVLIALYGANSGDVALARIDGAINQAILCLKSESSNAFIYQFLSHRQASIISTYLQGGQGNLSGDIVKSISLGFPTPPEQNKIASCLSSVDELIAAQARKVDALKTHKKGLMQQLFPREGETQPRLRFPEFQDAGEWVTEPLSKLADYENGKAYEMDIIENGKYVVVNSRFISTDGAVRKYTNADYLIAKTGEVLMVLSDLPKGKALAKCYFVEADDRYAVNQRVCRLKPTRTDGKFLYYILNRHPRLLAYDDGLNQTHLSKGGVTECPLCVPPTIPEQQRIASCLSDRCYPINRMRFDYSIG